MLKDKRRYKELLDPVLQEDDHPKTNELNQGIAIAALCVSEEPMVRPIMTEVVRALSSISIDL